MRSVRAELVLRLSMALGEGPRWRERRGELAWVDIDRCLVHAWRPRDPATRTIPLPAPVGAVCETADGGLAGLQGVDLATDLSRLTETSVPLPGADPALVRGNDARCDAAGRWWIGTMALDLQTPCASLYRRDVDGTIAEVATGLTISNGLGWSPDWRWMYHVDTPTGCVTRRRFDLASGALGGDPEPFVAVPAADGQPDGLAVDAEGGVWVALWGGGQLRRYDAGGSQTLTVEVPGARNVTALAFGGADLRDVYITTAVDDDGTGGDLYHHRSEHPGLPEQRLAPTTPIPA